METTLERVRRDRRERFLVFLFILVVHHLVLSHTSMISGYDIFLSAEAYFVPIIDIVEEFIVAALWDEGTSLNHVISWCSFVYSLGLLILF